MFIRNNRRNSLGIVALLFGSLLVRSYAADPFQPTQDTAQNDRWALTVHLNRIVQKTGLLNHIKAMAKKEGEDFDSLMKRYSEVVDIDPLKDLIRLNIVGKFDIEQAENAENPMEFVDYVELEILSTGNVEDMMTVFPEYKTEDHAQGTIHSFKIENQMDCFVLISKGNGNAKTIRASLSKETLTSKSSSSSGGTNENELVRLNLPSSLFESIKKNSSTSKNDFWEQTGHNIIGMFKQIDITAVAVADNTNAIGLNCMIKTGSEENANRLKQLIGAGGSFLKIMLDQEQDDADVQKALQMLEKVKIDSEGETLKVSFTVDLDKDLELFSDQ